MIYGTFALYLSENTYFIQFTVGGSIIFKILENQRLGISTYTNPFKEVGKFTTRAGPVQSLSVVAQHFLEQSTPPSETRAAGGQGLLSRGWDTAAAGG